jgi:hypothetical protein
MDIKLKTCDIRNWKTTFISRHILHQHWYTCPIALPVRRNPQHRRLLTVVSATFAPPFQLLRHQRNVCHLVVKRFTRCKFPTVNRKYFLMNITYIDAFCQQNKRTTESCSSLIQCSSTFAIWLLKSASEHYHALLLPRQSWSWTMLLPGDTYRKPITSIRVVLLPFVTYLLSP